MNHIAIVDLRDDDKGCTWFLHVEFDYRPCIVPVNGWRDGGDAGDGDDIEITAVHYMGGEVNYEDSPEIKVPLALLFANPEHEKRLIASLRRRFAKRIDEACFAHARTYHELELA